jgi:hypothetical protein
MTVPRPLRGLLVLTFAVWMTLCCCEKRMLAAAFAPTDDGVPACCADHCCAQPDDALDPDESDRDAHPRTCADGCCTKAATFVPPFVPDLDLVGAPLPPALGVVLRDEPRAGRVLAHENHSGGEPPPRLALIISRRLRI